jgi:CubicO group peptidase (beta-lactamase class C family)
MTRKFATATLISISTLCVFGQVTTPQQSAITKAEEVGMSSSRLQRLKTAMQTYADNGVIAGAVTLVARRGRVVHLEAVGSRDVEDGARMSPDTVFRVRSMTKPIVTVAAMMLYEEGRFLLTDPISKWIPEFRNVQVVDVPFAQQRPGMSFKTQPAAHPILVRHLLTHTAGLANDTGFTQAEFQKIRPGSVPTDTIGGFVGRLAKLPLNFEPGTAWQYGFATDVVARLVEIISGQSLDEFVRERIFRPLQMRDTQFYLPSSKLERLAAVYRSNADGKIELSEAPTPESPYVGQGSYYSATGGLTSTALDYFRFNQMLLNGGELNGVRLLGRKTVELMTTNHTGDLFHAAPGMSFGLGYAVVQDVGASTLPGSAGMYTWPGSLTTTSFVDPAEQLVAVMLIQLQPRSADITNAFQVLVYQAVMDPPGAGGKP